ncbi:MAG: esterase-like activity of phytase family protein [Planctomycetota bacterium]
MEGLKKYVLAGSAAIGVGWTASAQVGIVDPGQGPVGLSSPPSFGTISELSGLAGNGQSGPGTNADFFAVSDEQSNLYAILSGVNLGTGLLTSPNIVGVSPLESPGSDLEGVGLQVFSNRTFTLSEAEPAIRAYINGTAQAPVDLPLPSAFQGIGGNSGFGLESLAVSGTALATANEQPLASDAGTNRVRVQTYSPAPGFVPFGLSKQVSYDLGTPGSFLAVAAHGVVDLEYLPNGDLLVLERALGVRRLDGLTPVLGTTSTISLITVDDLAAAADTSGLSALGGETPVESTVLWTADFDDDGSPQNYEGLALGPELSDGSFSLLLVSDNGVLSTPNPFGGTLTFSPGQTLYPLIVSIPEPGTGALLGSLALWALRHRRRG